MSRKRGRNTVPLVQALPHWRFADVGLMSMDISERAGGNGKGQKVNTWEIIPL